jgi:hypothetical protein
MLEGASSGFVSAKRFPIAVAVFLVSVVGAVGYGVHEHGVAKQQAAQNEAAISTLSATHDQVSALTAKLDAMNAERQAEKAAAEHAPVVYRKPLTGASERHRIDDPRWKKVQGQLDEQAKQIGSTRQDLTNTRTELQGSIATTHDELVMLEKKGERSYFEFDLDKAGQLRREGPVGVRLRKANTKHQYADLEMLVDDFKVSKKHVNIYEPVVFYSGDRKVPVELVINSIGKNHIHGYVSEPKYKEGDLEAKAGAPENNSPENNTTSTSDGTQANPQAKPSPARQKLEAPNVK